MPYRWHSDPEPVKPQVPDVTLVDGVIKISKDAKEALGIGDMAFAYLGWDETVHTLAFKPAPDKKSAFKVNGSRGGAISIKSERFSLIDLTRWKATKGKIVKEPEGVFAIELDRDKSVAVPSTTAPSVRPGVRKWKDLTPADFAVMGIDQGDTHHETYYRGRGLPPKAIGAARRKAMAKLEAYS
ncbi:MAG: hypothetical protein ACLQVD_13170 [Capsulimonadaceae bacterium]